MLQTNAKCVARKRVFMAATGYWREGTTTTGRRRDGGRNRRERKETGRQRKAEKGILSGKSGQLGRSMLRPYKAGVAK